MEKQYLLDFFQALVQKFLLEKNIQKTNQTDVSFVYSLNEEISLDCSDPKQIERFINGFFQTNVNLTQMKISDENKDTLELACTFRYIVKTTASDIDIKTIGGSKKIVNKPIMVADINATHIKIKTPIARLLLKQHTGFNSFLEVA
jgi:hypothetical protein